MLATFMEVIDTSIASVALPHIAGSLSATTDEATWVLTSYLVANAVVLPASGWFALKFGRKRFLITCILIFTAASFACGAATSLGMILVARAIQGAGGGALQPLSQAILLESFPPEKRGSAMAIFALGVVVAPVLGPTLGGWLTDQYSWRWAFYVNLPVGALALTMISRFVHDPPYIKNAKVGRIDAIGLGLLAIWVGALQIVLDKGQEDDWFGATWIRWTVAIIVIGLAAFFVREMTAKEPLVKLKVFCDRNFLVGCALMGLFGGAIYGLVTILPLFYQTLLGYTASAAGWAVSPRGIGAILIMPVIAVLTQWVDNRALIFTGFIGFALTSVWMSNLTMDIGPYSLLWPVIFSGAASGMVFVPLSTAAMGTLRNEQMGNAAGLFNLLRNVGGGVGISVVNTLISRRTQIHRAYLAEHIGPQSVAFQQQLNLYQTAMSAHADGSTAALRARELIDRTLDQQATLLSYVDDLRYMAIVCFACGVMVFLMKKVKSKGGAGMAH
jgi:DHA2 family multidrug resistance protein